MSHRWVTFKYIWKTKTLMQSANYKLSFSLGDAQQIPTKTQPTCLIKHLQYLLLTQAKLLFTVAGRKSGIKRFLYLRRRKLASLSMGYALSDEPNITFNSIYIRSILDSINSWPIPDLTKQKFGRMGLCLRLEIPNSAIFMFQASIEIHWYNSSMQGFWWYRLRLSKQSGFIFG